VPRQVRLRKEPVTHLVSISAVTREAADGSRQMTIDGELPPRHDIGLSELERNDHFRAIFRGLSRREQLIMSLLYVDGLTMDETGRAIGVSLASISLMIERLREKITPEQLCG
jgi:RNA polymerase sigma factor (sigma-70 family)